MTETIKLILSVLGSALPLVGIILTLIIKYAKSEKSKKNAEKLQFWTDEVSKWIKKAEQLLNSSGAEKKSFVMTNIQNLSEKRGIKFNPQIVSDIIENTIEITKEVNKRTKDNNRKIVKLVDSSNKEA